MSWDWSRATGASDAILPPCTWAAHNSHCREHNSLRERPDRAYSRTQCRRLRPAAIVPRQSTYYFRSDFNSRCCALPVPQIGHLSINNDIVCCPLLYGTGDLIVILFCHRLLSGHSDPSSGIIRTLVRCGSLIVHYNSANRFIA